MHFDALQSGNYDIAFVTSIPDVADAANFLGDFLSESPENYAQWRNPDFDTAFASVTKRSDPAQRIAGFLELENRILAAAPVAPLYFNTKIWLMSPQVRNWQEDGLWTRSYAQIYLAPE